MGLDEVHDTAVAEHEVEGRLLLDVVVREGAAVLVNAPDELKPCLPARISISRGSCHISEGAWPIGAGIRWLAWSGHTFPIV